jgi:hypothetical protein
MAEIRTRCTQGHLVVTDEYIRLEKAGLPLFSKHYTILRSQLTGIESKVVAPSFKGKGGTMNLVFHGAGLELIKATLVKGDVARQILSMLQHP